MFQKIMVLLDDQSLSQAAIHQGIEMASAHQAAVVYLYMPPAYVFPMVDMPGGGMAAFTSRTAEQFEQQVQSTASEILKAAEVASNTAGVSSTGIFGPGNASPEYVAEAAVTQGCDLIVVASPGTNAVVRLLSGHVIPGLISRSLVPLMICPTAVTHNPATA